MRWLNKLAPTGAARPSLPAGENVQSILVCCFFLSLGERIKVRLLSETPTKADPRLKIFAERDHAGSVRETSRRAGKFGSRTAACA